MREPIAIEIKNKVMEEVCEGREPVVAIAKKHGVKPNTVYGWVSDLSG